jgi:hypothetical protein
VVTEDVTWPQNDGTRGSALYAVPFRLYRRPSRDWATLFVENWDHPPSFTNMHRRGIARVSGDRLVLDGTTIEEVERYHLRTLKLVLERTNEEAAEREAAKRRQLKRQREGEQDHKRIVDEVSRRSRFD